MSSDYLEYMNDDNQMTLTDCTASIIGREGKYFEIGTVDSSLIKHQEAEG